MLFWSLHSCGCLPQLTRLTRVATRSTRSTRPTRTLTRPTRTQLGRLSIKSATRAELQAELARPRVNLANSANSDSDSADF